MYKYLLFVYSESEESEESDEEEMVAPLIPRTFRINIDTPEDDDVTTTATVPTHLDFPTPEMGAVRPYNLHDFEWNSFPDPPIPPNLRREKFSSSNVGPTTPCVDPYDTFIGIWDRQFMEHIASETNRYAQEVIKKMILNQSLTQKCLMRDWRPTTADELYTYFAIILAMGIVVKNNICEYWDSTLDIFYTPGFKTHMTAKRFQLLNKCLHFNSNENMCALKLDASEANLYKIEPVLSHLNSKFQSMYNMSQNIALDESLLLWKGVSDIDQFIANKAAADGIKTYEICEPQTGYMWRFEVHTHGRSSRKQSPQEKLETFTTTLVLRLIQGLEYKGHTLWMDSLYSSPVLARRLKSLGFDCVGTLRTNRQFVPTALSSLTKANMQRGEITGFTSGDVDLIVWKDLNRVAMISTYHGNIKTNDKAYPKPALIADYNIMVGGVDRKDQMLAMYPIERKQTRVWYKQFFRRLLNVSVLNCFILVKKSSSSICQRSFRRSLILSLLKKHSSLSVVPAVPSNSSIFKIKDHHLKQFPLLPVTHDRHRIRRVCTICKNRINTFCVGCDKAVCMTPCFVALHQ
ncbi:unnamed protein product [Parnassius mnemosyne]|uniref:PiggyBac transposable element-derived protein domain-containing protein n=1 Tax=Parnassius mnemosyne TaxID=213953 RepID=A0AAV1LJI6_9NEOP